MSYSQFSFSILNITIKCNKYNVIKINIQIYLGLIFISKLIQSYNQYVKQKLENVKFAMLLISIFFHLT